MTVPEQPEVTKEKSTFRRSVAVAVRIDAKPDRVWSLLTNAEDFPRWNSTITSMEGTIAVGEKVSLKVPIAPDRTFNLKVVEMVPEQKMVWADGFAPMFRGVRTWTLSEGEDGSTSFHMAEVMTGLMLPMIGGSLPDFGPPFETYAADLKREAEAG